MSNNVVNVSHLFRLIELDLEVNKSVCVSVCVVVDVFVCNCVCVCLGVRGLTSKAAGRTQRKALHLAHTRLKC